MIDLLAQDLSQTLVLGHISYLLVDCSVDLKHSSPALHIPPVLHPSHQNSNMNTADNYEYAEPS